MSRVVWGLVKWVIIPAALVALGYFYIGPKLGSSIAPTIAPVVKPEGVPAKTGKTYPKPEIDVSVEGMQKGDTQPRKRRRRRHRSTTSSTSNATAAPSTPTDEGGSSGAAGGANPD